MNVQNYSNDFKKNSYVYLTRMFDSKYYNFKITMGKLNAFKTNLIAS